MGCDPALCGDEGGGDRNQISAPACLALDVQRRKELNRIKKRFGLRVCVGGGSMNGGGGD